MKGIRVANVGARNTTKPSAGTLGFAIFYARLTFFGGVDVNIYVGDDVVLLLIAVVVLGVVLRKLLKQLKRLIE